MHEKGMRTAVVLPPRLAVWKRSPLLGEEAQGLPGVPADVTFALRVDLREYREGPTSPDEPPPPWGPGLPHKQTSQDIHDVKHPGGRALEVVMMAFKI